MAKRKRAPHEKPFSRPLPKSEADTTVASSNDVDLSNAGSNKADPNSMPQVVTNQDAVKQDAVKQGADQADGSNVVEQTEVSIAEGIDTDANARGGGLEPSEKASGSNPEVAVAFVGKWNRLITTTNWEKGKIICEWREALTAANAAVAEYSDEAWSRVVGGVTSQHVGRLRRVSERFGDVSTQYETLHWSHFQACLDWDDAEMWLEGSIQNGWSVSQMRGKRWETVGKTPDEQKAEVAQLVAEQESEAQAEEEQAQAAAADQDTPYDSSEAEVNAFNEPADGPADELPDFGGEGSDSSETAEAISKRTRLSVDVESLPDDLAEAFESFKLAIIAHRRENWRDATPESVVECLESLKELALVEADVV